MNNSNAQQMHNDIVAPSSQPQVKVKAAKEASLARTDVRYWQKRVEKPTRPGYESPFYSAQIAYKHKRVRFPLETSDKRVAAEKARNIYISLCAVGWEQTLTKFKGTAARPSHVATVGELIEAVRKHAGIRASTFQGYCIAFRFIASQVVGVSEPPKLDKDGKPLKDKDGKAILHSSFNPHTGGRAAWLEKVDAISLSALTPEIINRWRQDYISKAGSAPDLRKRAVNSSNSHLRNARSLFSDKALQFVRDKLILPDPLPFTGIKPDSISTPGHVSRINPIQLIEDAKQELGADPACREEFKLFCLCLICGLRRGEADALLWQQVDLEKKHLRIETTKYFQPKSEDSCAAIDLDDKMAALLSEWRERATSEFVIESVCSPRYSGHRSVYRCHIPIANLIGWLRGKGVTAQKPLHELRKELGSVLSSENGIWAAKEVLRHADIRLTSLYYADKKVPIVSSLGTSL